MKNDRQQIGAWEDWPKAEQQRYRDLKHRRNAQEHLSLDDFRWFMHHDKNLKFFKTMRTRYAIRNRNYFGPGPMAVNGFNTGPR